MFVQIRIRRELKQKQMGIIWQKKSHYLAGALISMAAFFILCSPGLAASTSPWHDGDLIRSAADWKVFIIACGKKYYINNTAELNDHFAGKIINVVAPEVTAGFANYAKADAKTCPVYKDKLIKIDLKTQTLAYFEGDNKIGEFLISSGVKGLETPTGNFTVLDKVPVKDYGGPGFNFYLPNTKWNLHFATEKYRFYIHGAYWHHNFGHPMSHGCINVSYANMEPLYNWAEVDTKIEIH